MEMNKEGGGTKIRGKINTKYGVQLGGQNG